MVGFDITVLHSLSRVELSVCEVAWISGYWHCYYWNFIVSNQDAGAKAIFVVLRVPCQHRYILICNTQKTVPVIPGRTSGRPSAVVIFTTVVGVQLLECRVRRNLYANVCVCVCVCVWVRGPQSYITRLQEYLFAIDIKMRRGICLGDVPFITVRL